MNSRRISRRHLLAMSAMTGAFSFTSAWPASAQARFAIGSPLADFCAIDAEHRLVSTADWRGQVLFVHWFGSWCPPCRKEIPELAELERQFAGRSDVRFMFLNGLEKVGATTKWLASIDTRVPLYDSTNTSRQDQFITLLTGERRHNFRDMGLTIYPSSWLIDKRGVVKRAWINGQIGWSKWGRDFVEELAREDVPPPGVSDSQWLAGTWTGELDEHGTRTVHVQRVSSGKFEAQWSGTEGRTAPLDVVWATPEAALLGNPARGKGNGIRMLARATGEANGTFLLAKERNLLRVSMRRIAV